MLEKREYMWYFRKRIKGVAFMKKTFILFLILCIMVLSFGACGKKNDNVTDSKPATSEDSTETVNDEEMKKHLPEGMSFSKNKVDFIGRFVKKGDRYEFGWSGSTIRAGFVGTEISVKIELLELEEQYGTADYLEVMIDGERVKTMPVTKDLVVCTLAEDLEYGYHYVELIKRTGVVRTLIGFYEFDYGDGMAAYAPAQKERTIEFIGDSITAGWGNMSSWYTQKFILSEQDATRSYGYLVAKSLNAEAILTAISGSGIVLNSGGSRPGNAPLYWKSNANKYNPTQYDFSSAKQPDAVVINLGTNDYLAGVDEEEFFTEYLKFVEDVRRQYPNAYILCTIGTMTVQPYWAIQEVVAELNYAGDNKVSAYEIKVKMDKNEMIGAVGHPSAKCHEEMAKEITAVLKERLGW